jgi:NADH-quinone oxidoreductase subunit J
MESLGNVIIYVVIALAIIVFSVLAVTTKKILRSATYLLFVLLATAGIYFQMDYEFLGATQIAVYAGGIVVLFVFAIMLTHKPGNDAQPLDSHKRFAGLVACGAGVVLCGAALLSYAKFCGKKLVETGDFTIDKLGEALLSTDKFGYLLPFEAVSVLLLACIIGGVVIARKR